MVWFKVDDKLHDHDKAHDAGTPAMGLWVLAGSWASDNCTDGFVPERVLSRWGTKAMASRLVAAGLWRRVDGGWLFHDWGRYNPSAAATEAKREAESAGGVKGNHQKWHVRRGITEPDCPWCRVPDQVPEGAPESGANPPVPVPEPDVDPASHSSSLTRGRAPADDPSAHLADVLTMRCEGDDDAHTA
ncbi:hypothetical protein ACIRON_02890 [Nocardioides sp. NPDC101246]|uniref:hypothetical protein n=1 Tax=Nocardioides sp. NPDC101246 TaxID=3364336 RepID=UPI0037F7FE8B